MTGAPIETNWAGHTCTAWMPLIQAQPITPSGATGLYPIRQADASERLYVGQAMIASHLAAPWAKQRIPDHPQGQIFAHTAPLEVSWIAQATWLALHRLGLETDLIGVHVLMREAIPQKEERMRRWMTAVVLGLALPLLAAQTLAQGEPPAVHMPLLAGNGTGPALPTTPPRTATPTATPTATATATSTITPSATPTQTPILLPNGDFEQGPGVAWEGEGIIKSLAHSGVYAAALVAAQTTSELTQIATVPASAPHLSYWVYIASLDPTCGDDLGSVAVIADDGLTVLALDQVELCIRSAGGWWLHRSLNLSAHIGATVTVSLQAGTSDGSEELNSWLYVDDVGWVPVP